MTHLSILCALILPAGVCLQVCTRYWLPVPVCSNFLEATFEEGPAFSISFTLSQAADLGLDFH